MSRVSYAAVNREKACSLVFVEALSPDTEKSPKRAALLPSEIREAVA